MAAKIDGEEQVRALYATEEAHEMSLAFDSAVTGREWPRDCGRDWGRDCPETRERSPRGPYEALLLWPGRAASPPTW